MALELLWISFVLTQSLDNPSFGLDFRWHLDASRRLLEVGTPYWPWQVAGPYTIANGAILYPPIAFALFIPFLVLPGVLWWAIPITVTILGLAHHRPPVWVWPVVVGLFCLEKSLNPYVFGNPTMWIVAAVAAGTAWGWPFAFVLLKPTFVPLAVLGSGRRSWWITLSLLGVVSLAFGSLWLEWIAVVWNSGLPIVYNLPMVPLILAPLVPWVADPSFRKSLAERMRSRRLTRSVGSA